MSDLSPFDALAAGYDSGFGRSAAGRLFRFRFAERVCQETPPGAALLDIGAGTGEDAAWFAAQGLTVTGIDPSAAMLEVAGSKGRGLPDPPAFIHAGLLEFAPARAFDAVYSNFGAMNCVPLPEWRSALERLVKPGGRVILVLMGRRPLPEALRRGRGGWIRRASPRATVGDGAVEVTYPGPREVARALAPSFRLDRTETMGVLVPRPGLDAWPVRNPILFGLLAAFEAVVAPARRLAAWSDHYLVELTRLPDGKSVA